MNLGKEFLVGCLVLFVIALLLIFGWLMNVIGPFRAETQFFVLYSFAGGVEVGSPVRVSGVKVGKVDKIEFLSQPASDPKADGASLKLTISASNRAAEAVRADSKFYINMAGIIGERYIEITPGGKSSPLLSPGSTVRGVDPPRIDQLLSQGYGVFGRIQEFLEQNEEAVTDFISQTTQLLKEANSMLADANRLLKGSDRRRFFQLVDNMNEITANIKGVTKDIQSEKNRQFFEHLRDLVGRAHEIDKPALKKFLQEEGVRARIF